MYSIVEKLDRTWVCEVRIQDGIERFTEQSRQEAIFSVIKSARILNGTYITEKDIEFLKEWAPAPGEEPGGRELAADANRTLLDKIRRKELVVLPHNDPRVAMNITPEECDLIRQIREGDIKYGLAK